MMVFIFNLLLKAVATETAKTVIAMGVKKLLEDKKDGITRDLAVVLIDSIAMSKKNNLTKDLANNIVKEL